MTQHTQEILRSSFDVDGIRLEFVFDCLRNRYSVATRYAFLAHFDAGISKISKRLAHERASSVFEFCCFEGATRENASAAKRYAQNLFPNRCAKGNGFEREVIRRATIAIAKAEGGAA